MSREVELVIRINNEPSYRATETMMDFIEETFQTSEAGWGQNEFNVMVVVPDQYAAATVKYLQELCNVHNLKPLHLTICADD